MALSQQDKEFYAEKLRLRSYLYLLVSTTVIGMVACPLLLYIQDSSAGLAGKWTYLTVVQTSCFGFLIGVVVSTFLYLTFRIFLEMEWLPSRR